MKRIFISIALVLVLVALAIMSIGGNPLWLVNLPTLLVVGVLPFLAVSTVLGFARMRSAFSAAVNRDGDRSRLEPALVFFRAFGRAVNAAGLIGLVAGLVLILAGLDDPLLIGPNAAMALMSLFYSGLVHLAVIIPFTAMIKNRIAESNDRELP